MHKELQNTYNSLTSEMSTEVFHPLGFNLLNSKVENSHILTLLPSPSACWLRTALAHSQRKATFFLAQAVAGIPSHPLRMLLWDTIWHHRALDPSTEENYLELEATG